ncbi:hypothetical protein V8C43DRAFT_212825 [Trichoderma afarasin]
MVCILSCRSRRSLLLQSIIPSLFLSSLTATICQSEQQPASGKERSQLPPTSLPGVEGYGTVPVEGERCTLVSANRYLVEHSINLEAQIRGAGFSVFSNTVHCASLLCQPNRGSTLVEILLFCAALELASLLISQITRALNRR